MKKLIPQSVKNIYHLCQAILANFVFGFPSKNLAVIGVTGTNGKTTTCQMIAKILEEAGFNVALSSTINFKLGKKEWVNSTKFTTLSSFKTQKFIKQAVEAGCDYLILEITSHSLDQNRVWGIKFDTAVITNATREHLDYHHNMERYRIAKLKLFKNVKTAVVNLNMEKPEDYLNCGAKKIYGYAAESLNVKPASPAGGFQMPNQVQNPKSKFKKIIAENIELGTDCTKYQIQDTRYLLHMPGLFNVENALGAISVAVSENINLDVAKKALEKITGIPGRMEYVPNNRGINIIIDYAVTPDSLEKLYFLIDVMRKSKNHPEQSEGSRDSSASSQNDSKGKIIAVFGACGERDRGKRPMMGEIVSRYADYIILTNEDPYNEDPWQIINEVAEGVKNKEENRNFWKIMDRRAAIKKALRMAEPGDYVIITGKGAEMTMAIGDQRIPWNDKKIIQEVLPELGLK